MDVVPLSLIWPGTWLDLPDQSRAHELSSLFHLMQTALFDASISLGGYLEAQSIAHAQRRPSRERWEQDVEAMRAAEVEVRVELGLSEYDFSHHDLVRLEAEKRLLQKRIQSGQLPTAIVHRLPFVHARSFLFAMHSARSAVVACRKQSEFESAASTCLIGWDKHLPGLKGVRDSSAHVDERVQRKGRKGEIKPAPLQNAFVSAPNGGAFIIESLNANNFGGTLEDGSYGEVPITSEALATAAQLVQTFWDQCPWKGPKRLVPSPR